MYITVKEISEKWGISERRVRKLCEYGKIEGCIKKGKNWNIPQNTVKPEDGRKRGFEKKGINMEKIRREFPFLKTNEIYLDNAGTTQKPKNVIKILNKYYEGNVGNPHSAMGNGAEKAEQIISEARRKAAKYIGANNEDIIFTKSATESLNLLANGIGENILEKEKILITKLEHNSNIIPYQILARKKKAVLEYVSLNEDASLNYEQLYLKIKENPTPKIIGITMCSNVTGEEIKIYEILEKIREYKEKNMIKEIPHIILDATQYVAHKQLDISKMTEILGEKKIYVAFSGHKMYAINGVGVCCIPKENRDKVLPLIYGGGMVDYVYEEKAEYKDTVEKYEAGTPNVAAIQTLGAAITYMEKVGINNIEEYLKQIRIYGTERLREELKKRKIEYIDITHETSTSIISVYIKNLHPHDMAYLLGKKGISVRAGHHCAVLLHKEVGMGSSLRISLGIYNKKEEVDIVISEIMSIWKKFNY